jgi:hypothetical protein
MRLADRLHILHPSGDASPNISSIVIRNARSGAYAIVLERD